ncbi:MAG: HAD-IA family hydrolase [Terriglobia bacterium]
MASGITTIFSDVGGVLGTNGLDHAIRKRAVQHFGLDGQDFEERHELVVNFLELGSLSLSEYLERTVFYRERPFTPDQFRDFMFAQSKAFPESIALFERLAASKRYLMATLNNESVELNLHRIETFGLRRCFSVFFSSCFLGLKKPDDAIYRMALKLTQRSPQECLFVDDRKLNLERAARCGIRTLYCQDPIQLEPRFREAGIQL